MTDKNSKICSQTLGLGKSIGILGGTFDPIHLAHTQSAQTVADELGLSKVLLIPAHISPHKISPELAPHATAKQRAAMVDIVCEQNQLFGSDKRELHRLGRSFTVDTLKELKLQYPKHILYFIIGMDSLLTFTQWHNYQEILALCHLVVNTRPNYAVEQMNQPTKALLNRYQTTDISELTQYDSGKIFFAKQCFFDISSTQIRQRLAVGQNCDHQLLPAVTDFIHKNNLYR